MTVQTTEVVRPLSEQKRDTIRNDILDSEIKNPKQSESERAAETARIARKRKVTKMQVAGVRAALSSGTYGERSKLVARRKRELRKASS
jgi:hypothetical protein